ncbi:translocation/assembly module TamB domain-containing protein [Thermoleptolyngbya sichuanensis XZ-Cy5]|uniref:translocation/assembly module TamB domain-containing protein n=1 Tax=Thermoleptolyngbya sichuanensis TaxID=2885951 RepID=UPI00240D5BD3|nr:translocation/assembly module TamB domain-containing protein [Thermoleptolyngbya sichuanensis XZ-Cy5]
MNSPEPPAAPQPPRPPRRRLRLAWRPVALGLGLVALAGSVGGTLWVRNFLRNDLAPLLSTTLSETINRPVQVGPLQGIALNWRGQGEIVFGESVLPPTETDGDRATVQQVRARFNLLDLLQRRLGLVLTLQNPDIFLDQTDDGKWIAIELTESEDDPPLKVELRQLLIADGTVTVAPSAQLMIEAEKPGVQPDSDLSVRLQKVNGEVNLDSIEATDASGVTLEGQNIRFDVTGNPGRGGALRLRGEGITVPDFRLNLVVQSDGIAVQDMGALLAMPVALEDGRLSSNLELRFADDTVTGLNGTARFADVAVAIADVPKRITQAGAQLRFRNRLITIEDGRITYGTIPVEVEGTYDLREGYNLSTRVRNVDFRQIEETADVTTPITLAGAFDADVTVTGPPDGPIVAGTVRSSRPLLIDKVAIDRLSTRFSLVKERVDLTDLVAQLPGGGVVTGGGVLGLGEEATVQARVQARNLPADALARTYGATLPPEIVLGRVNATAQVEGPSNALRTAIQWQAAEATYPARGELLVAGENLRLQNTTLEVAGGRVSAEGDLVGDRWQAVVRSQGVGLRPFSPELAGTLDGTVRLAGTLADPTLAGIRAEGDVRLSQGVSLLTGPLTADFRWLGDRLVLNRAAAPGFRANGTVFAQTTGNTPEISSFDLALEVQDFDLNRLPVTLPPQVRVAGRTDFSGRVSGTPAAPNVNGLLALNGLAINQRQFDPRLAGPVQFAMGQGVRADLTGYRDQISLDLDGDYLPRSFLLVHDGARAAGTRRNRTLVATLDNLPLDWFALTPAADLGLGLVTGTITASADVNLDTYATEGNLTIVRPAIGYLFADQFSGRITYRNDQIKLEDGLLALALPTERPPLDQPYSTVAVNGSATLGDDPQFEATLETDNARIQDVLNTLRWYDFDDVARGFRQPPTAQSVDLATVPIQTGDRPIYQQLQRYSEILALLDLQKQQDEAAHPLPRLAELQGNFEATLNLSGSVQSGVTADFNLAGENWQWGEFNAQQVIAQGTLQDGVLELLPLRLGSDEAFLSFNGQFGADEISGQLQAQSVDITPLQDIVQLPISITGRVNGNAFLQGSLGDPEVRGEVSLFDAKIQQQSVRDARALFSYDDARARIIGQMSVNETEPLRLRADIPYAFDFMDVSPDSEAIAINLSVKNEGLELLSLFTNQVAWAGGEADINLDITGTLSAPLVTGAAEFNGASMTAPALPEPLTNITGRAQFNTSFVDVEGIRGQFRQGEVVAEGILPIFNPNDFPQSETTVNQPLTVSLNQVVLNLKGLYSGGVDGAVQVTGTALAPVIGGDIALTNGRVQLLSGDAPPPEDDPIDPNDITIPPRFDNLRLSLGRGLRITLDPLLDFLVAGELRVNGTVRAPRPEGELQVRRGIVNLFTTQFNLVRGYNNTAEFTPQRGLDPYLQVQLVASVPEVTRTPITTSSGAAEINETLVTDLGSLSNVRVIATVDGYASEMLDGFLTGSDTFALTSSPARSDSEIIALIGGGFINTFGQGDSTLAIANLAGSALLPGIQGVISEVLGLSDFRLFPTLLPSENASSTTLELAAEAGIDLFGTDLSGSVLAILTADAPVQFNLRYRINDQFLIRSYIDTDGGTGAILEFETRF